MAEIRRALLLGSLLLAGTDSAHAQSTDGYHLFQVFPIVVDTASFAQHFHFSENGALAFTYYPAQGTSQVGALDCGTKPSGMQFATSLRALCPTLPAGSQFGMLVVRQTDPSASQRFAGYSRISNPQGNGFSVEAFPLHTFASADAVVTGLRRLAAGSGSPAFQSNCFVANLPELGTPTATPATVRLALSRFDGVALGATDVTVQPGQMTRLLDVFATVGAPPGDHPDAVARFSIVPPQLPSPTPRSALVSFCTVQDNTSFGADFRIAKQESAGMGTGARDDGARHLTFETASMPVPGPGGTTEVQNFYIDPWDNGNAHVFYFRNPDLIGCSLHDQSGAPVTAAYGLEMRLTRAGQTVIGQDGTTQFEAYLGDKLPLNSPAARYVLEVESNGNNASLVRYYGLRCTSGSGHTRGDLIRYHEPGVRF